jgi:hypothetical protein
VEETSDTDVEHGLDSTMVSRCLLQLRISAYTDWR